MLYDPKVYTEDNLVPSLSQIAFAFNTRSNASLGVTSFNNTNSNIREVVDTDTGTNSLKNTPETLSNTKEKQILEQSGVVDYLPSSDVIHEN